MSLDKTNLEKSMKIGCFSNNKVINNDFVSTNIIPKVHLVKIKDGGGWHSNLHCTVPWPSSSEMKF